MAKKVVAKLQKREGKTFIHAVKMVKSDKTGSYIFKEKMVDKEKLKDFFAAK